MQNRTNKISVVGVLGVGLSLFRRRDTLSGLFYVVDDIAASAASRDRSDLNAQKKRNKTPDDTFVQGDFFCRCDLQRNVVQERAIDVTAAVAAVVTAVVAAVLVANRCAGQTCSVFSIDFN